MNIRLSSRKSFVLGFLAILCASCAPSMVVNSEADSPDINPGDGNCATADNTCTLRAALMEANAGSNGAFITFENVSTITPATALPALTGGAIKIRGEGTVTLDGGQPGDCSGFPGLEISESDSNEIQGLTIVNFGTGIDIDGWGGDAKSNVIGPIVNSEPDPAKRNVIGGNCRGIYIHGQGAFGNTVVGNYIGTNADGSTANPNTNAGIYIVNGAHDNLIGTYSGGGSSYIDLTDHAAYWNLDEANGNRDDSVGANSLTDNNTVLSAPGKIKAAADFEKGSSEFLEIADNAELSTGDIDFTFAGWVMLESKTGSNMNIVSKHESATNREYRLFFQQSSNRFVFQVFDNAGTIIGSAVANQLGSPALATWYFIAGWHDSVNNQVGIQINNGAADTAATSGVIADKSANFRMGAQNTSETSFWDGLIDEFGFWKRVLTPQEISTLYNSGNGLAYGLGNPESNVISGNGSSGIHISGSDSNHITGNLIGVTVDGKSPLGNGGSGIYMTGVSGDGSDNNVIGVDAAGSGGAPNVISANEIDGIVIQYSNNNLVAGNFIGTNITGTAALGNGESGLFINTTSGTVIGTNGDGIGDDQERNIISGNGALIGRPGIWLIGVSNVIAGNYIGTNIDGTVALGNSSSGISLGAGGQPGFSNRIGTNGDGISDVLESNLISGNGGSGISLASYQNRVSGNLIGTTADGMSPLGNGYHGVSINLVGHSNLIGTDGNGVADASERNVISANGFNLGGSAGIAIQGSNNVVAGNYIGINAAGTAGLGNSQYGVIISKSSLSNLPVQDNLIGTDGVGNSVAEANVISGNGWMGVVISEASDNQVSGNFIGTDVTGSTAIPNVHAYAAAVGAVHLQNGANANVIGTNGDGVGDAAERNVISGNATRGIHIGGQGTNNNTVAGNYIGTNAAGTTALGNVIGVEISDGASANLIGTNGDGQADSLEANVISANAGGGVVIIVASSNEIAGNFIGTDKNGTAPLGNGQEGIEINASNIGGTNGNAIGGTPQKANVIAFNSAEGVEISGFGVNPINGPILYNSIFSNGSLGINLHPSDGFYGITLNDAGDTDSGANNLMNFPALDTALSLGGSITITGDIDDGLANTNFLIQFFASPTCDDPSGHGEGKTFVGESNEMTNGSGDVSFLASFAETVSPGYFITATATFANNTSEFSECVEVVQGSQLSGESQFTPPPNLIKIVPLQNLNCRYFCTSQSEIADTLLEGVAYSPVGWDPVLGFLAFDGPTFGERCFAPPLSGGTPLMTLTFQGQEVSADQITDEMVATLVCPAFSTPTPTVDIDEGDNGRETETPTPPAPRPQCSDGIDNDGDRLIDYSATGAGDRECRNANDNDEAVP